jgi:hypothetical protein
VDEKVAALLIKTSGLANGDASLSDEIQEQFGRKFVQPMEEELVSGMRLALGVAGESLLDALLGDDEA